LAPPPIALQLVAPVEDHVSVNELPLVTDVALEVRVSCRATILRLCCVEPVAACFGSMLVQVRPKVNSPAWATSEVYPTAGVPTPCSQLPPGMPPVSRQEAALVDDHEIRKVSPATTVAGLKDMLTVGGGAGSTVNVSGVDVTLVLLRAGTVHVADNV